MIQSGCLAQVSARAWKGFLPWVLALAVIMVHGDEAGGKERFWNQSFTDIQDKTHRQTSPDTKAVVWIFILEDCPIANAFVPEINRMVDAYGSKGVRFFLIHTNPGLALEQARDHQQDYALKAPVILDVVHDWVAYSKATATPEAFVFDPQGKRMYRGRIDDRFPALGKRRIRPSRTELRDALDSLLKGEPVAVPETKPIGCYIPPLPVNQEKP